MPAPQPHRGRIGGVSAARQRSGLALPSSHLRLTPRSRGAQHLAELRSPSKWTPLSPVRKVTVVKRSSILRAKVSDSAAVHHNRREASRAEHCLYSTSVFCSPSRQSPPFSTTSPTSPLSPSRWDVEGEELEEGSDCSLPSSPFTATHLPPTFTCSDAKGEGKVGKSVPKLDLSKVRRWYYDRDDPRGPFVAAAPPSPPLLVDALALHIKEVEERRGGGKAKAKSGEGRCEGMSKPPMRDRQLAVAEVDLDIVASGHAHATNSAVDAVVSAFAAQPNGGASAGESGANARRQQQKREEDATASHPSHSRMPVPPPRQEASGRKPLAVPPLPPSSLLSTLTSNGAPVSSGVAVSLQRHTRSRSDGCHSFAPFPLTHTCPPPSTRSERPQTSGSPSSSSFLSPLYPHLQRGPRQQWCCCLTAAAYEKQVRWCSYCCSKWCPASAKTEVEHARLYCAGSHLLLVFLLFVSISRLSPHCHERFYHSLLFFLLLLWRRWRKSAIPASTDWGDGSGEVVVG
uniref:Uncharacterized protein n=1 Tax=Palpitomonas bilix TaxID=652834 RepID=A0A7S3D8R4_9EUKA|mmetsp:Transcript_26373/g.67249  ORF Transcript_26373/g.67249 Transcript_26373/m.67249 type:complete len:515 (+) Transcript_26373:336-1880(+)